MENGKLGYLDKAGNLVIKTRFESGDVFQDGIAQVVSGGKIAYIDRLGRIILQTAYESGDSFVNGLARVNIDRAKWGYINKTGTVVWESGQCCK